MEIQLTSRYIVGLAPFLSDTERKQMTEMLESRTRDPDEMLDVLIVEHKLRGDQSLFLFSEPGVRENPDTKTALRIYSKETIPPDDLAQFRARHGWFAELAIGDADPTNPAAARASSAATRTLFTVVLGLLLALAAILAGLILLIITLVKLANHRLHMRFPFVANLPPDRRAYVQAFLIYLLGYLILGGVLYAFGAQSLWAETSLIIPPAIAILWLRRTQTWPQIKAALGLHRGAGVLREMGAGLTAYTAGLPLVVAAFFLTTFLTRFSGSQPTHPIVRTLSEGPTSLFPIFLLASIIAPLVEELMFRGVLLAHLRERFGFVVSALIVALIFAAIHPQGWTAIPVLAAIAMILAFAREWRGSAIANITAHALNNTLLLAFYALVLS